MDKHIIKQKSLRGGLLTGITSLAQFIIIFLTQIVFARSLEPKVFGVYAFAMMIIMFVSTISKSNGDKYYISEEKDTRSKINAVFSIEIILTLFISAFTFLLLPKVLNYLGKPEIVSDLKFLTILLFYNPLSLPRAILEKELMFGKSKYALLASNVVGSTVGIVLLSMGHGIWSLYWFRISTLLTDVIIIWYLTPYKPKFEIKKSIISNLITYCLPLMGSSILIYFYWNIDYFLIQRLLGEVQLGYYWLAFQVGQFLFQIKSAIITVVFPAFSKLRDDKQIQSAFEKLTELTTIIFLFPATMVMLFGSQIIIILYGESWSQSVFPFKIITLLSTLRVISGFWDPIIWYKGKTNLSFYMSIYMVFASTLMVYFGIHYFGINGAALGIALAYVFGTIIMI